MVFIVISLSATNLCLILLVFLCVFRHSFCLVLFVLHYSLLPADFVFVEEIVVLLCVMGVVVRLHHLRLLVLQGFLLVCHHHHHYLFHFHFLVLYHRLRLVRLLDCRPRFPVLLVLDCLPDFARLRFRRRLGGFVRAFFWLGQSYTLFRHLSDYFAKHFYRLPLRRRNFFDS